MDEITQITGGSPDLIDPEVMAPLLPALVLEKSSWARLAFVDRKLQGVPGTVATLPYWKDDGSMASELGEGVAIETKKLSQDKLQYSIREVGDGIAWYKHSELYALGGSSIEDQANASLAIKIARKLDLDLRNEAFQFVDVANEAVGTGDATAVEFSLDHNQVLKTSLVVKVDGVVKAQGTDYTVSRDAAGDKITFGSAPANGKAVTASYKYSSTTTTNGGIAHSAPATRDAVYAIVDSLFGLFGDREDEVGFLFMQSYFFRKCRQFGMIKDNVNGEATLADFGNRQIVVIVTDTNSGDEDNHSCIFAAKAEALGIGLKADAIVEKQYTPKERKNELFGTVHYGTLNLDKKLNANDIRIAKALVAKS